MRSRSRPCLVFIVFIFFIAGCTGGGSGGKDGGLDGSAGWLDPGAGNGAGQGGTGGYAGGEAGSAGTRAGQGGTGGAAGVAGTAAGEGGAAGEPPDPQWMPPPPPVRTDPDCAGFPLSCGALSEGSCASVLGCFSDGECDGFARSCSGNLSHATCIGVDGCLWNSSIDRCTGSSWSCDLYSGSLSCASQPGCSWSGRCEGTATECEALTAGLCETQDGCALSCPFAAELCDGKCVDPLDDEDHCGSCGFACGPRGNCTGGACECGAPFEACAGRCVDVTNDPDHCGACGKACGNGFVCAEGACQDVDECLSSPCTGGRSCSNTAGGFTCGACPAGFAANGATGCADIDECSINHGGCAAEANCFNTAGSHSCGPCPAGFTGDGSTACDDIDECAAEPCDALVSCTNSEGSFQCSSCPGGYSGTGLAGCFDIDECATNNGGCDGRVSCTNTPGGRTCGACPAGYDGDGDSGCLDIDECASNNGGCASLRACVNSSGSHSCGACQAGYAIDGATACVDIDECATSNGGCHAARMCMNTVGSSSCGSCGAGYTNSGARGCTDINECATNNGGCGSLCVNSSGSYHCACSPGSRLTEDNVTCYTPRWRASNVLSEVADVVPPDFAVAMNATGVALAVFTRAGEVSVARRAPLGSWTTTTAFTAEATSSFWPAAALNAAGDGAVTWNAMAHDSSIANIWSRSVDSEQGLMTLRAVENDTTVTADTSSIAVTADSTTHVLYGQYGGVWYTSAAQGAAFSGSPLRMDTEAPGLDGAMALELRPDGSGVGVYSDGTPSTLYARLRSASGEWSAAAPVLVRGVNSGTPVVALGANGEIMLVVGEYDALRAVYYRPATGWGAPMTVHAVRADGPVDVAADGAGNFFAVWTQQAATDTAYVSRFSRSSGAWSSRTELHAAASYINHIHVAASAAGDALAVWSGNFGSMRARRYLAGSGWQADTTVFGGTDVGACDVAMSSHGNAVVMYSHATDQGGERVTLLTAVTLE